MDRVPRPYISELNSTMFRLRLDDALDIYLKAMNYDPQWRHRRRDPWWNSPQQLHWKSYGAFVSEQASGDLARPFKPCFLLSHLRKDPLVGITYGAQGDPQSWWSEQIRLGAQRQHLPQDDIEPLLKNYFELSELHVQPPYQGQGIGRHLLAHMIASCSADYMMLSTPEVSGRANAAWTLYRHMGFRDLLRHHFFPGDPRSFAILWRPMRPQDTTISHILDEH